ncbi:MAG TPA: phosphoglycerate mutase family protein [Thermoanaerobaculia bacterium]|jgi:phosphohistidine phosphatase|nr:phosphoglycerate mutase family protein [Thermoanaerobaculia bacterium]
MDKFVVLLRHGIAAPGGTEPDETRELTDEGHRRMRQIARGFKRFFPKAETIISSPLTRALQTATWVGKALDLGVVTSDALRPESDANAMRALIEQTAARRIILVGHEPSLTGAMLALTKLQGKLELKKGGCYAIRFDHSDDARLVWMLPPRVLRVRR